MNSFIKNLLNKRWLGIALILLIGIIAYHNCLPNEMFWDDDDFILKNRFIKDFHNWPLWFSQNLVAGNYLVSNYWRPLLLGIFAVEWHWWKNWVYGWHTVSVSVHILAAFALYFLLDRLFNRNMLALLTALIFVAHPVHNEAVVYVNSMGDALASLFVLSSLLLYVCFRRSQKPAWRAASYWASLLLFPLGLLSKETSFVLAGLIPFMDFLLLQDKKYFWDRVRGTTAATWPFLLLAITYVILRATVLNFSNSFNFYNQENVFTSHPSIRIMTFFKALTQYTGFLFFPYQLRVERQLPWAQSIFEWDVLTGGIIAGTLLVAAFKYWKTKPWISFGIGWFFIAIAPASNILIPINAVIYEHFLYLPMIGIALIFVHFILDWTEGFRARWLLSVIMGVILILFCLINIRRNLDWRTSIGFYEQLITFRPDDYRVINNLGMEYANKGILDKAEATYLKAIALDPHNPVAYHNIAGTYRDTGRTELALKNFQKALELNPNFIFSYRSLADLYWRLGQYDKCRDCLLRILQIDPSDAMVRKALQMTEERLRL
ncbi:MAG: tetratricopeptide repeat protein [Candidatus Omnitrophica bacterium]|nr:tetratricopeptide repeat protein [Candidatus Omnitrophota bacterium]